MKTNTKRIIAYASLIIAGIHSVSMYFNLPAFLQSISDKIPVSLVGIAGIGALVTVGFIWDEAI